jgi:hypothetical protein
MRCIVGLATISLLLCASRKPTDLSFGEYYSHTPWIDCESHTLTVDAFGDRLVVTGPTGPAMSIKACWRGRAFLSDCRSDFFGVAKEGADATFSASPLKNLDFKRVRPDPT